MHDVVKNLLFKRGLNNGHDLRLVIWSASYDLE